MESGTEAHRALTPGTPLVETDANEVSADSVWLRRSPIGYLCIGLGPSVKVARFAFEDVAPEHPFYAVCRRIERDVAREGLAKARRLGLRIPFHAFEDRALRRIAIASALLKAGFDPQERRDKDGEWTTGEAGAAAARVSPGFLPKPPPTSLLGRVPREVMSAMGELAARAFGAIAVFRILFIPSNQSLITEGTVPDRPDIRFKYDDDERVLTIHRDGADGSTYGFSAKPGPDGVFRDDQGRAFARRLDDGTVVIDPDALPSADSRPSTRNDQPKLCPDPGPDRRGLLDENGELDESKVDRAAKYQAYISSIVNPTNPLPIGLAVELPNPRTGEPVSFDECRQTDGTMIEVKGPGYLEMLLKPHKFPWTNAEDEMVWQARRQLEAAQGRAVEWYFAEDIVAEYMRDVFRRERLPITVKAVPPPP